MRTKQFILTCLLLTVAAVTSSAQIDKREVRKGNRDYRKEDYKEAEIEYRKAIVKDSLSVAANYNLAADLYRQDNSKAAQEILAKVKEEAAQSAYAADYFYNLGDVAIANQDWQTAVDAFQESLLRNPADMDARENYIYAKKKLEQQQQQQQQNDQNQDNKDNQDNQNQNDQNNQDKKDDQDNQKDDQKNKDQNQDNQDQNNKDDDQNDQKQDDRQDNNDQNQDQQQNEKPQNQEGQPQQQEAQITPQAAQQMLQAIQAKEKETQDKVNKKKAMALKSRQKDKNW